MAIQFPKLIAHRGASIYAPENTLAALRRAAELGATWVECDVTLTADGYPIILHDHTLDRTTSGKGALAEASLEQVCRLDAGSWFAPQFTGEKVPTLDEWLGCAAALNLSLNLELKVGAAKAELLADKLMKSLKQYWPTDQHKLLISSFTHENLRAVRALDAQIPIGFLVRSWSEEYKSALIELNCSSLNLSHRYLDRGLVKKLNAFNLPILAYTVDDKRTAARLFEWGVASVFSNDPCMLK